MRKGKILVLGAGVYQKPLILKAKEMGHTVLVVSPKGRYPGIELGDLYFEVDTTDTAAVLKIAKRNAIDAIVTTGTDVCLPTLGAVTDALELNGVSFETALKCMDKALMKKAFKKHNVPTANFQIFTNYEKAIDYAREMKFPLMVKASDSSGSRGVYKVEGIQDFKVAFNGALKVSRNKKIVIEDFLDGIEFGAQAIVANKELVKLILHGDIVNKGKITTPIGHFLPIDFEPSLIAKTNIVVKNAIKALDISDCVSNIDFILEDNEPKIIEIGARMGGTCLPENVSIFYDENIYAYLINMAMGNNPKFNENDAQANASLLLTSDITGVLESVDIPKSIYRHPNLIELNIDVMHGDIVNKFKVGPDRLGHVITKGDTASEACAFAKEIASLVTFNLSKT